MDRRTQNCRVHPVAAREPRRPDGDFVMVQGSSSARGRMESFIVVPGSCPFTISGGSALWGRRDLRTVPRTGAARGSRPESGPARAFKHSRRRVGSTARCVDLRLGCGARQRPAAVPCGGPMPPDGLRSCQPPQHDRGGSTQTDRVNTIGLMYLASHRMDLSDKAALRDARLGGRLLKKLLPGSCA